MVMAERRVYEKEDEKFPHSVFRLFRGIHPLGHRETLQRRVYEVLWQFVLYKEPETL